MPRDKNGRFSGRFEISREFLLSCVEKGLSQNRIAQLVGCSRGLISKLFKQFSIPSMWSFRPHEPVNLTVEQQDVLSGVLLGDGHLTKRNSGNSQLSYLSCRKEQARFVGSFFVELLVPETKDEPKHSSIVDKRTGRTYHQYRIRTQNNPTFSKLRHLWYQGDRKIIPENLTLNGKICLFWYMDDGGLINTNGGQEIKLSTHCFSKREIEKQLLPQLSVFNPRLQLEHGTVPQFSIRIPRDKIQAFLSFVGDCPIEELRYKWMFKPYKRPTLADKNIVPKIMEMSAEGLSDRLIGEKLGMSKDCVRYHKRKQHEKQQPGTTNEDI